MKLKNILITALVIVIVIGTVVAVSHFGGEEETPTTTTEPTTETPTETPTEAPADLPLRNPVNATGKALSEDEIKEFLTTANELYMGWVNPGGALKLDWDKETTINGEKYSPAISGEFMTVNAINEELQNFFSEEVYKEQVCNTYIMHNGKLYVGGPYKEGGDIAWSKVKLTVKSNTSTECTFTATAYFEEDGQILEKQEFNYKLKVIDGKWKFVDSFDYIVTLTADSNILWVE